MKKNYNTPFMEERKLQSEDILSASENDVLVDVKDLFENSAVNTMTFKELLNTKKDIRLGFLGGSITEVGYGLDPELGYRRLVTKELGELYPNNTFTDVNAGIGGTGSALGLFRLQKDVLDKNVDMVFVEFAVNDDGNKDTDIYMENIVRSILRYDNSMPIMFIYTVQIQMINAGYSKGVLPMSVEKQEQVAKFYNIPSVNVGFEIYKKMQETGKDIMGYTVDTCHPNAVGHRIYADHILKALENAEFNYVFGENLLTGKEITEPKIYPAKDMANSDWALSTRALPRFKYNYIYSYKPGTKLEYTFDGTTVGFMYLCTKDNGKFTYSIDGSEQKLVSTWDVYCNQWERDCYVMLANDLEKGKHTLTITVSDEKDSDAEGTYIQIGAFMVG